MYAMLIFVQGSPYENAGLFCQCNGVIRHVYGARLPCDRFYWAIVSMRFVCLNRLVGGER